MYFYPDLHAHMCMYIVCYNVKLTTELAVRLMPDDMLVPIYIPDQIMQIHELNNLFILF